MSLEKVSQKNPKERIKEYVTAITRLCPSLLFFQNNPLAWFLLETKIFEEFVFSIGGYTCNKCSVLKKNTPTDSLNDSISLAFRNLSGTSIIFKLIYFLNSFISYHVFVNMITTNYKLHNFVMS